jgi:hypothetical protein
MIVALIAESEWRTSALISRFLVSDDISWINLSRLGGR